MASVRPDRRRRDDSRSCGRDRRSRCPILQVCDKDHSMPGEWYLMLEGTVKGPLSARQLRSMARAGELRSSDRVSRDGGHWLEASRIKGLFESDPGASAVEKFLPVASSELLGAARRGDSTRG